MININQLSTFITVVEERGLSTAAGKLNLTQPAVSLHIQNLDDYFGTNLLIRRGKEMEPTPVGEHLFREGKKLIAMYKKIEDNIFSEIFKSKNQIVIGAGPVMTDYVIPHMMGFFKRNHPEIDLVVHPINSESTIKGVLDHSLDVGFVGYQVKNNKLTVEEWIKDDLMLIVPADHPFAKKESICLDDLKGQDFVWHKDFTGIRIFFEEKIRQAGKKVDISPSIIVSSTLSVLTSVQAGLGISLISSWVAEKHVQSGMIASVPISDMSMVRNLYIITHRVKKKPPVVLSFLEASKEFKAQFGIQLNAVG